MFLHRLGVDRISESGAIAPVQLRQIDNFCMRNFTNDAVFDDTLPVADGVLEVGSLVPLDRLQAAMEDWFRRKGYFTLTDRLRLKMLLGPYKPVDQPFARGRVLSRSAPVKT